MKAFFIRIKVDVFKTLLILMLICALSAAKEQTYKKTVIYGNLITEASEKTDLFPSLVGYGCWCRKNGFGVALDEFDSCCQMRSRCYDEAEEASYCSYEQYNLYSYTATSSFDDIECKNTIGTCKYKICTCDKKAIDCYLKNRNKFNISNMVSSEEQFKRCKCSAGKYYDLSMEKCIACPDGFHNEKEGQIGKKSCKKCLAGTIANYDQTKCEICKAGTFTGKNGMYCTSSDCECEKCPNGYICPKDGTSIPEACPYGMFVDESRTVCKKCPPGTYYKEKLYADIEHGCKECPDGHMCPDYGTIIPISCEPGTLSNSNKTKCVKCTPGTYTPGYNSYTSHCDEDSCECLDCLDGYICPTYGTITPVRCLAGTIANTEKTNCTVCVPGTYTDEDGYYCKDLFCRCSICPSGYVCPDYGTKLPVLCTPGTVANFEKTKCFKCEPGRYISGSGNYCTAPNCKCGLCPDGHICPDYGTAIPIECEAGSIVNFNRTRCIDCNPGTYAGEYCSSTKCECELCPKGFICPHKNTIDPIKCEAGSIANFERTECIKCKPGTYSLFSGSYCKSANCECMPCLDGHICPDFGTVFPQECPTGTTTDADRVTCISSF